MVFGCARRDQTRPFGLDLLHDNQPPPRQNSIQYSIGTGGNIEQLTHALAELKGTQTIHKNTTINHGITIAIILANQARI